MHAYATAHFCMAKYRDVQVVGGGVEVHGSVARLIVEMHGRLMVEVNHMQPCQLTEFESDILKYI